MIKRIMIFVLGVFVISCASQYVVNDNVLQQSKSLNTGKAMDVLRSQLAASEKQAGVCQVVTNAYHNKSTFVRIDEKANLYASGVIAKQSVDGTRVQNYGSFKTVTVNMQIYYIDVPIRLNLRELSLIRIKDTDKISKDQVDCPEQKGEISLWLKSRDSDYANALVLKVARVNLDDTLAALLFLSPGAELKAGVGF